MPMQCSREKSDPEKMPLLNLAFISIYFIIFVIFQNQIRLKRLTKTIYVKKADSHVFKTGAKCIYIVKIYLLESKHYRQARREPGTMFGARAIQRRREKEEELKV